MTDKKESTKRRRVEEPKSISQKKQKEKKDLEVLIERLEFRLNKAKEQLEQL